MGSFVRLLGFTTLGCGCIVGRYRELATNRDVNYVEEKGNGCVRPTRIAGITRFRIVWRRPRGRSTGRQDRVRLTATMSGVEPDALPRLCCCAATGFSVYSRR